MRVKYIHRVSGLFLMVFIFSHLAVHLTAAAGSGVHLAVLDAVQWIYRNPLGEIVLVVAIVIQIVSGAKRLRLRRIKGWARWQVISGMYLMMFLLVHTSAALIAHHLAGVETDFFWAAGSLYFTPIKYVFGVYYFLAVLAVFIHVGAAIFYGWRAARKYARLMPVLGAVIGAVIISAFSGMLYPIEIPADVQVYYEGYFGFLNLQPK